uniref:Uncharacterized protein n=1 Tax=Aegilops tauschii subsp. strangulata TaxID=200361 RepID=A0A453N8X4_AEGTS
MRMDPKATLTAEDILNSWPELEVGRILRDYGEESNWQSLQRRIVKERKTGGLHSTGELVKLIQRTCTISGEDGKAGLKLQQGYSKPLGLQLMMSSKL